VKGFFSAEAAEGSPRYYGWIVVGLTFFTMAAGGSIVGTFPVFYVAFLEEFGWTRADTALAFSFSMVTFAFSAGLIGALVDRWGPRIIIPCGIALLGAGLALMSTVSSLWTLYVVYGGVVALGITMFGFIPTSTVVSSWFVRRRSTAMGLALSGRSLGGMVMVPLSAFLIGRIGWRGAYLALAAGIVIFLVPLNAAFHKRAPSHGARPASAGAEESWTLRRALRDPAFWLLFLAGIFHGVGFSVIGVHQVAHMVDVGVGKLAAASLIGLLAVLRAAGGVAGGWVADRLGRVRTFYLASAAAVAGIFILMNLTGGDPGLAYLYVLVYGLGAGARGAIFVAIKADIYPGRSFGRILGVSQLGAGLASAFGPWAAGYIFDVPSFFAVVGIAFMVSLIYRSAVLFIENQGLRYQTSRDGLTDLFTYRYMEHRLMVEFDKAKREKRLLTFVIFDLDHFKRLNDGYGHEKGNEVLLAFAGILKKYSREEDIVARYGGEEFCLLLPEKGADEAKLIADRIRESISERNFRFKRKGKNAIQNAPPEDVRVTVSAGICSSDHGAVFNGKELLRLADSALLTAKSNGRNRIQICSDK